MNIIQKIQDMFFNLFSNVTVTPGSNSKAIKVAIYIAAIIILLFIALYICCWLWLFIHAVTSQRVSMVSELRQFIVVLLSGSAFTVFSGFLKFMVDKNNNGVPDTLEQSSSSKPSCGGGSSSSSSSKTKTPLTTGTYNT